MHSEGILIHVGINFVISPAPEIDRKRNIAFQNALIEAGIDFSSVSFKDNEIAIRRQPSTLEIKVATITEAPVGQVLIIAPIPNRDLEAFSRETDAILKAFNQTWREQKQILASDSTIRYLYETSREHAFLELWETMLRQPQNSLDIFGRPILGGGLRFVMPPIQGEEDPTQVEVKIESYLQDSKKIFVEVEFKWPQPRPPSDSFDPAQRLKIISDYLENHVIKFIIEGHDD